MQKGISRTRLTNGKSLKRKEKINARQENVARSEHTPLLLGCNNKVKPIRTRTHISHFLLHLKHSFVPAA